ncbi:hypothetical protein D3C85_1607190 [compost metagenome]
MNDPVYFGITSQQCRDCGRISKVSLFIHHTGGQGTQTREKFIGAGATADENQTGLITTGQVMSQHAPQTTGSAEYQVGATLFKALG